MATILNYADVSIMEFTGKNKLKGRYVTLEDYNQEEKKYKDLCKSIATGLGLLAATNENVFESVDNKS